MNSDLEAFLKKLKITRKETTLFDVGGRGYFENPASDLLAFFLKPNAEHNLGPLFLSTYLECMKEDSSQFDLNISDDHIRREVLTKDGSFIDLQILGLNWCLIVENKINHSDANPFTSYENHAKSFGGKRPLFSILSPDGHEKHNNGTRWVGVSYQNYCSALLQKMPDIAHISGSKWQIFAREFILHFYNPPMEKEQIIKVEKYFSQIAQAEKLAVQYREFVRQELKFRLDKIFPGKAFDTRSGVFEKDSFPLSVACTSQALGKHEIVLFKPVGADEKFSIKVHLNNLSDLQLSTATKALNLGRHEIDGAWHYWTFTGYDSGEEAIAKLCELAKTVSGLFNSPDSTR